MLTLRRVCLSCDSDHDKTYSNYFFYFLYLSFFRHYFVVKHDLVKVWFGFRCIKTFKYFGFEFEELGALFTIYDKLLIYIHNYITMIIIILLISEFIKVLQSVMMQCINC